MKTPVDRTAGLLWLQRIYVFSNSGVDKVGMLLCRHQATAIPGSNYISNAIWRRNWKSKPCVLQANRLDDPGIQDLDYVC